MSLADRLALAPDFGRTRLGTETLDRAILSVATAFPGVQARAPDHVDTVIARLESAAQRLDWTGVSTGDVALGLYQHTLGERSLSPQLRHFLDAETQATTRPQLVEAVAEAYLAGWDARTARTREARALIIARSRYLSRRWSLLFQTCPEFLDLQEGPAQLGLRMIDHSTPYAWLVSVGLPAPHGTGFMAAAHTAFLNAVPDPIDIPAVERLIGWARPVRAPALDDQRAAQVVDRIISPWLNRTCPENFRAYCSKRLVEIYGDPRREHREFWRHVRPETKRILFRWLARSSMEAIFEIVTESERLTGNSAQWIERRRFWTAIYEQGRIDEAWFALGADAVPHAKKLYQQTRDDAYRNYDLQMPRRDTCLLFMKIGEKVFVEGSHNFRIHVFPTPSRTTPAFYNGPYDLDTILLPMPHDDARIHSGDWREWVKRRIGR